MKFPESHGKVERYRSKEERRRARSVRKLKPMRRGREMDVAMVEQRESKEVARTQNKSEQDSRIRKVPEESFGNKEERNRAKDTSKIRLK